MKDRVDKLLHLLRKQTGISYITVIVLENFSEKLFNGIELGQVDIDYINDLEKIHNAN